MQKLTGLALVSLLASLPFGCAFDDPGEEEVLDEEQVLDEQEIVPDAEALEAMAAKIAEAGLTVETQRHAPCGTVGPNIQNTVDADAPVGGAANQRSGSSTGCTAVGALQPTDDALYFCFTHANDGFTWTYLRNQRTGVRGWVRDDLLDNFGSTFNCGF